MDLTSGLGRLGWIWSQEGGTARFCGRWRVCPNPIAGLGIVCCLLLISFEWTLSKIYVQPAKPLGRHYELTKFF